MTASARTGLAPIGSLQGPWSVLSPVADTFLLSADRGEDFSCSRAWTLHRPHRRARRSGDSYRSSSWWYAAVVCASFGVDGLLLTMAVWSKTGKHPGSAIDLLSIMRFTEEQIIATTEVTIT